MQLTVFLFCARHCVGVGVCVRVHTLFYGIINSSNQLFKRTLLSPIHRQADGDWYKVRELLKVTELLSRRTGIKLQDFQAPSPMVFTTTLCSLLCCEHRNYNPCVYPGGRTKARTEPDLLETEARTALLGLICLVPKTRRSPGIPTTRCQRLIRGSGMTRLW